MRFLSALRLLPVFRLLFVFLISFVFSNSAFAFDAKEYVEKLQQSASARGITITYGSLEPLGDAGFIINDVVVEGIFQQIDGIPPTKIKQIRVEGVEELSGNSFAAKLVEFGEFSASSTTKDGKPVLINIANGKGENIYFADPADLSAPIVYFPSTTYQMGEMTTSIDGKQLLTVKSFFTKTELDPETRILSAEVNIDEIDVNLKMSDDPEFVAQREALGYDHMLTAVALSGSWDMKAGLLEVSNYSLDVKDAGRLKVKALFSGYTEELAMRFRTLNAEIQTTQDPTERKGKTFAMMAMMSQIALNNMSLTFEDKSLTDRMLTIQAAKMGMAKSDLAQMLPTIIPRYAMVLQNPEFIGMLAGNVAKFLDNPGDISIHASPPQPVPLTTIMITGATQPEAIIDLLNVGIEANTCQATC